MSKFITNRLELAGQTFGRLTVLEFAGITAVQKHSVWRCVCSCDESSVVLVQGRSLVNGGTRSCGCLASESTTTRSTTHGKSRTSEYRVWAGMKDRCLNPNSRNFPDWGGRGIQVCQRWQESFEAFLEDVGLRPEKGMSLDRINNAGNYEPGNVRWATWEQQQNNRRSSSRLTYNGETKTLPQWAREFGLKRDTLQHRIHDRKWDLEQALSTPVSGCLQ